MVIDKTTFDTEAFKIQGGGFNRINKIFGEKLEEIIGKLKTYMFEDIV